MIFCSDSYFIHGQFVSTQVYCVMKSKYLFLPKEREARRGTRQYAVHLCGKVELNGNFIKKRKTRIGKFDR